VKNCECGTMVIYCYALSEVAYVRVVFLHVYDIARWSVSSGLYAILFMITCGPLSCCAIGLQCQLDHIRLIRTRQITLRVSRSPRPGQIHESYKTMEQGHWGALIRRRQSSSVACRWSCCRDVVNVPRCRM